MCVFTKQELLVLSLIAKGMLAKEIAEKLDVSAEKINKYKKSVYCKLNARNRVQAVVKAIVFGHINV